MDLIQIILALSLLAVSTTIVFVSISFIKLMTEARQILIKTTAILDDTHQITSSVAKPVSSFSEFLMGFRNGLKLFNKFAGDSKKSE